MTKFVLQKNFINHGRFILGMRGHGWALIEGGDWGKCLQQVINIYPIGIAMVLSTRFLEHSIVA